MQTFAPEGRLIDLGFQTLDYKRLGKQRVEAWQILNVLRGVDNDGNPKEHKGWVNHPATLMWEGNIGALAFYGLRCCVEWKNRGYKDTMYDRFFDVLRKQMQWGDPCVLPTFLDEIALSHKSNLIRKFPEHYQPLWPDVPATLDYIWPVA
jgi:hypothetical protein